MYNHLNQINQEILFVMHDTSNFGEINQTKDKHELVWMERGMWHHHDYFVDK